MEKNANSVKNNNVPIIRTLSPNKERYLLTQSNNLLAKIRNPSVKAKIPFHVAYRHPIISISIGYRNNEKTFQNVLGEYQVDLDRDQWHLYCRWRNSFESRRPLDKRGYVNL